MLHNESFLMLGWRGSVQSSDSSGSRGVCASYPLYQVPEVLPGLMRIYDVILEILSIGPRLNI